MGKARSSDLPDLLKKSYDQFYRQMDHWMEIQENKLVQILSKNAACPFGHQFDFKSIHSSEEYANRLPVFSWDEYKFKEKDFRVGEPTYNTSSDVSHIVPSSGTTGANKRIPYTKAFLEEYRNPLFVWIADLYYSYPKLKKQKAFWSLSPHIEKDKNANADAFPDDLLYFGDLAPWIDETFAIDTAICGIGNFDHFMEEVVTGLVATKDLGFISVWHPSYLKNMLSYLKGNRELIRKNLSDKKINFVRNELTPSEFEERENILTTKSDEDLFSALWPELQLISCWTEGEAFQASLDLKELFPELIIQAKGLLATEGLMTIPLTEANGAIPAFNGHYMEFLNKENKVVPGDKLDIGRSYSILLTTSNGLYRYRIGDQVMVKDYFGTLPVLSFEGRENTIDLCGEKLTYSFIRESIENLLSSYAIRPSFYLFAPSDHDGRLCYHLFLEVNGQLPQNIDDILDESLRKSVYYDHARRAGQLASVAIKRIEKGMEKYRSYSLSEGQNLGNIKYFSIDKRKIWTKVFE